MLAPSAGASSTAGNERQQDGYPSTGGSGGSAGIFGITGRVSEKLRQVSYLPQMAAGMATPTVSGDGNTKSYFSEKLKDMRSMLVPGAQDEKSAQSEGNKQREEYDEQLQEDVFLGRMIQIDKPQVKNTFIQFDKPKEEDPSKEWTSSPAALLERSHHTIYREHEQAHRQGTCKPCAYHWAKEDGCRMGKDCTFCHLCQPGELKKRKQEKKARAKAARQSRKNANRASPEGSPETAEDGTGFETDDSGEENAEEAESVK